MSVALAKKMDNERLIYMPREFNLTDKNFLLFAAKHYDNPNCHDLNEFHTDLAIPLHIKKLFTRYSTSGILKDRLLINHFVCFFNVFDPYAAVRILFYKADKKHYSYLKTVLYFLNRCPTSVTINGTHININEICADPVLLEKLENNVR